MARECYGALARWILLLVLIFNLMNNGSVEGRYVLTSNNLSTPHKGTKKTIESYESGEIIDCVDIYSQPSLDNLLIKTVQMEPSSYPDGSTVINRSQPELFQSWRRSGECPEGTIPRIRTLNQDLSLTAIRKHPNSSFNDDLTVAEQKHEYAIAYLPNGDYHGARATISVWDPTTEPTEISVSQIWLKSEVDDGNPKSSSTLRTLEAGWIIFPQKFGDSKARLFIYWTNDGYQSTGCYNLDCPGFVQTSKKYAVGAQIDVVSTYNGAQRDINASIFKDKVTGDWWLQAQNEVIGHWPSSIGLGNTAKAVHWGGEITNASPNNHHTTTQMGSGHFSGEKFGKSSFFTDIGVMDPNNNWNFPKVESLKTAVTNPTCYDLTVVPHQSRFYYGGPGYNPKCIS